MPLTFFLCGQSKSSLYTPLVTPSLPSPIPPPSYSSGLESECLLAQVPALSQEVATVQVIPAMPQVSLPPPQPHLTPATQVSVSCELLSGDSYLPLPSPLTLYSGQLASLRLTVTNTGQEPVHQLEAELLPPEGGGGAPPPLVSLQLGALQDALPLQPGETALIPVTLQVHCPTVGSVLWSVLQLYIGAVVHFNSRYVVKLHIDTLAQTYSCTDIQLHNCIVEVIQLHRDTVAVIQFNRHTAVVKQLHSESSKDLQLHRYSSTDKQMHTHTVAQTYRCTDIQLDQGSDCLIHLK